MRNGFAQILQKKRQQLRLTLDAIRKRISKEEQAQHFTGNNM
ncbi:hypothetical protein L915_12233 [Phytophthora nicotianae]|uniref:Uncharacterized protein n=1 Tax=Phytophthora nicotianae TaxID=4792 RepID=W2GHG4_PHYNI|nr:hypothetical protein L915_12233 [Phytophthora nicotianae]